MHVTIIQVNKQYIAKTTEHFYVNFFDHNPQDHHYHEFCDTHVFFWSTKLFILW